MTNNVVKWCKTENPMSYTLEKQVLIFHDKFVFLPFLWRSVNIKLQNPLYYFFRGGGGGVGDTPKSYSIYEFFSDMIW